MNSLTYLIYGVPLVLLMGWYLRRRLHLERISQEAHETAQSAGLIDPVSLHPIVDPARCIGCGSCVKACPEQPLHHVLGIVGGRAELDTERGTPGAGGRGECLGAVASSVRCALPGHAGSCRRPATTTVWGIS